MGVSAGLTVLGSDLYVAMGNGPLNPQNGTYGNAIVKLSTPDMVVRHSAYLLPAFPTVYCLCAQRECSGST